MADLDPLIRVRRHNVEQKQKFLAELYRQVEELETKKKTLEQQIIDERGRVDEIGTAEVIAYYGRYAEATRKKIRHLSREIKKMETRIDIAREDMREAFAELKKIEITQRNREDAEKKEQNKKENQELDEVAIDNYRRRQSEE